MSDNRICKLFGIKFPIVQGGMIWCSGWKLASAVSNAGGLGLIGAGSMYPEVFYEHVTKCKKATDKPFGVNIPLLYPHSDEIVKIAIDEGIKIVFTSAGNPKKYTERLKSEGITVVHVIANTKFALKCVEAGVDAIVAEGFEAGGHNGFEETTTMALIPLIRDKISIPLIAAGGIGSGRAMLAAFALGAEGVQIGSLFAAAKESSAHDNFKRRIVEAGEGDTVLTLKDIVPVRLIKNEFQQEIELLQRSGASVEALREKLGKGRSRMGMFEGNEREGELEIGQVSAMIQDILPVTEIVTNLITEFQEVQRSLHSLSFLRD